MVVLYMCSSMESTSVLTALHVGTSDEASRVSFHHYCKGFIEEGLETLFSDHRI